MIDPPSPLTSRCDLPRPQRSNKCEWLDHDAGAPARPGGLHAWASYLDSASGCLPVKWGETARRALSGWSCVSVCTHEDRALHLPAPPQR